MYVGVISLGICVNNKLIKMEMPSFFSLLATGPTQSIKYCAKGWEFRPPYEGFDFSPDWNCASGPFAFHYSPFHQWINKYMDCIRDSDNQFELYIRLTFDTNLDSLDKWSVSIQFVTQSMTNSFFVIHICYQPPQNQQFACAARADLCASYIYFQGCNFLEMQL